MEGGEEDCYLNRASKIGTQQLVVASLFKFRLKFLYFSRPLALLPPPSSIYFFSFRRLINSINLKNKTWILEPESRLNQRCDWIFKIS